MAKAQGRHEPARCVHHIFPRAEFPEYKWCEWNLISLSLEAHNAMHIRDTQLLTERGRLLLQETAAARGIDTKAKVILIIGLPGTGKTTEAKRKLKSGVCYDLDAIAAAFRLREPKAEEHKAARWMANELFSGFAEVARKYSRRIVIIRSAPTIDEVQKIAPNEIVICRGGYGNETIQEERRHRMAERIQAVEHYAKHNGIVTTEIENDY